MNAWAVAIPGIQGSMSKTFGLVIDFIIDTERSDAYPVAWCPRAKHCPPHLIVVLLLIGNVGWAHEEIP
ncbi:MAG: hypothetical protein Ct9H300mP8_02450 [Gammaproteobacteria bacterium]|nr:MAG: hypothetical protein Ct9H300mP8_02450 [Gammaproteobacteria bacterium]